MTLLSYLLVLYLVAATSAKSFTIHSVTLANDYSITAEDLVNKVTKSFVEYEKNLDDYINWQEFEDKIKDIENYNGRYSTQSIDYVRQVFRQSRNNYNDAVTIVKEWCKQINKIMTPFVNLFNEYSPEVKEAQIAIIVNVLDVSIQKMSDALESLERSRDNLNSIVIELTHAIGQLSEAFKRDQNDHENELNQMDDQVMNIMTRNIFTGLIGLIVVESKYKPEARENFEAIESSFNNLKAKMSNSINKALTIKNTLLAEIQNVVELQAAAKSNKMLIRYNFYQIIKNAANALITKCAAYQAKHGF